MKTPFQLILKFDSPFEHIANYFHYPKNQFSKAVIKILNNYSTAKHSAEHYLKPLSELNILDSPTNEHSFIYLMLKSILENNSYETTSSKLSLKMAKSYLPTSSPECIKNWYASAFNRANGFGDIQQQQNLRILNELNFKIPFEFWLWKSIAYAFALEGALEPFTPKIRKYLQKAVPGFYDTLSFFNYMSKFNTTEAMKHKNLIPKDLYTYPAIHFIKIMNIVDGRYDKKNWENHRLETNTDYLYYDYLIALSQNKPTLALEISKKIHRLCNDQTSWASRHLANAEISNNNIEAAYYHVEKESKKMVEDDHLILSRIYYQKNNLIKAAHHFGLALSICQRKEAMNYFSFMLRLAVDLKSTDVFNIMQELAKKSTPSLLSQKPSNNDFQIKPYNAYGSSRFIGNSTSSMAIRDQIKEYSKVNLPLLITGETGVGKEVVALALHEEGPASKKPFLPINCGAIMGSLLQSELFGHQAGSFTNAIKNHIGIFEAAGHGTVFLDELGEMSHETQVALLRVLETKKIRPVGSSKPKDIHCQIIAATNANIKDLVKSGKIRSDLYFRLKGLEIKIKPLRNRKKDIIKQAIYFLNLDRPNDQQSSIDSKGKKYLQNYPWPGNSRELKNEMHRLRAIKSNKLHYQLDDFSFLNTAEKDITTFLVADLDQEEKITLITNDSSTHRRIQKIKELFSEHKILRRIEIINTLKMGQTTATRDLNFLIKEGYIKKITPTPSARTHYFELA